MPRRGLSPVVAALILAVAGLGLAVGGRAADHRDAPGVEADPGTDITDVYGFRSPANPDNFVIAIDVSPFVPGAPPSRLFTPDSYYQIHIDRNGDNKDDLTLTFRFSSSTPQTWRLEGLPSGAVSGEVTPLGQAPVLYNAGGVQVFAGARDDPFFFDLEAWKDFMSAPHSLTAGHGLRRGTELPVDDFAGANVAAIVLELPVVTLTGGSSPTTGSVRAWVSTANPV